MYKCNHKRETLIGRAKAVDLDQLVLFAVTPQLLTLVWSYITKYPTYTRTTRTFGGCCCFGGW